MTWASGSPGYSISTLLKELPSQTLIDLIGQDLVEALRSVDASILEEGNLVPVALRLLDETEWISDIRRREALLSSLPLSKAEELLKRLGKAVGEDPFATLDRIAAQANDKELNTIFAFFGIQPPPKEKIAPSLEQRGRVEVVPSFGLFPHQWKTAKAVEAALRESKTVLLHMPTGSGKTRTAMHLIADHLRSREEGLVFWLSEQPEVLNQALETFHNAWQHLGNRTVDTHRIYGDSDLKFGTLTSGFAVGGFQKLHAIQDRGPNTLLSLGDRVTLVIVDEAHQAIAPTYNSVIRALARKNPDTRLLGLTATPGRTWTDVSEDYRLSEFFGGVKVTLITPDARGPVEYLVEEEYLARAQFDHIDIANDAPDSQGGGSEGDLDNAKLFRLLLDICQRHRRVILFANSVAHARLVSALLEYKNINAPVIIAETPSAQRELFFRRFRRSSDEPMVLVNYGVLTTGFDAPGASAAVIARRTRSLVLFSQMVGRVLRGPKVTGGTPTAEVFTTIDTELPGFGSVSQAFNNWEDVWND